MATISKRKLPMGHHGTWDMGDMGVDGHGGDIMGHYGTFWDQGNMAEPFWPGVQRLWPRRFHQRLQPQRITPSSRFLKPFTSYSITTFAATVVQTCSNSLDSVLQLVLGIRSCGIQLHESDLGLCAVGWGVPTATDISLAWMPAASALLSTPQHSSALRLIWHFAQHFVNTARFAILVFGAGHPAINYLLLLAIADDALGMARPTETYRNTATRPASPASPASPHDLDTHTHSAD